MNGQWKEFYEKAALLGHDAGKLEAGEAIITYGTFATLPEGRKMLSAANGQQRKARQKNFFNPPLLARQRLGQGIHDRGEAILFADGDFLPGDDQGVGNHMPAHIKAISILHKTIAAGETWDVTVGGDIWGIDKTEELYTTLNIGKLVIEPGAKLIVRGNVFSLLCQQLVCLPGRDSGDDYQLGILPTPFPVDIKYGETNGTDGINGLHGYHGNCGQEAVVDSSLLGYILTQPITAAAMNGGHGTNGLNGTPGADGRNGGMCKIAEIIIRNLAGHLTVFAQAGSGGIGGRGGNGGNGGNGGSGAKGHQLITNLLQAGNGGNAGNAGNGAKGGSAGHGGLASNIYINVPPANEEQLSCISLPSMGGTGGNGGRAGIPGQPGLGGAGKIPGPHGTAGKAGTDGKRGLDGRSRPAPWMFVNEQKKAGEDLLNNALQKADSVSVASPSFL
jgi:hypothetical protein